MPRPTFSSAIYNNASNMFGLPNGHGPMSNGMGSHYNSNGNSSQQIANNGNGNHEHSDSGLGAEPQDYGYSNR